MAFFKDYFNNIPDVKGEVELIFNEEHFTKVVLEGILGATTSIAISTADFKAMLIPTGGKRKADSIVQALYQLAYDGVEIRLLHSGVPSLPALKELKEPLPENFMIRRCPRLHAKTVIIDANKMYLGSANLTGAGLGAKGKERRNFETGIWTESIPLIDAVEEKFNTLWEGVYCEPCDRKNICPIPLEEPEIVGI